MSAAEELAKILGMEPSRLEAVASRMGEITGKKNVLDVVWQDEEKRIGETCARLSLGTSPSRGEVQKALMSAIVEQEGLLRAYIRDNVQGEDEFDKAARLARRIAHVGKGLFLKKECGRRILQTRPPENVIKFLGCTDVDEMLAKHEVAELFSALRFMETDEWMHETFDAAYGSFAREDFEERDIEIRVLPEVWRPVAEKFVAKKHHNVSHLKEFGVIFLNPIREDGAGKFLRDFALIFHYFHEIDFYSTMFRTYIAQPDFADKFKMLLRGDVRKKQEVADGEWLIVQQYLAKIDANDPRLFLPRVNPESVHWMRAERDLADFSVEEPQLHFGMWRGMDWVGRVFASAEGPLSFDLEDAAMTEASRSDGKNDSFFYHQREALWTKLFIEYAGGEEAMQKLLVENFDKGSVRFS